MTGWRVGVRTKRQGLLRGLCFFCVLLGEVLDFLGRGGIMEVMHKGAKRRKYK